MKLFSAETFVTVLIALVAFKLIDRLFLDAMIDKVASNFED